VADEHGQESHRLAMAQEKKQQEKVRRRRTVAQARLSHRTATALN